MNDGKTTAAPEVTAVGCGTIDGMSATVDWTTITWEELGGYDHPNTDVLMWRDRDEEVGRLLRSAGFVPDKEFFERIECVSRIMRGLVPNPQLEGKIVQLTEKIQKLYDMVQPGKSRALAPVEVEIIRQKSGGGKP